MTPPSPSDKGLREEVARIVDPWAFDALGGVLSSLRYSAAIDKADAILALIGGREAHLKRALREIADAPMSSKEDLVRHARNATGASHD